jgi:LysM domain-containing protein
MLKTQIFRLIAAATILSVVTADAATLCLNVCTLFWPVKPGDTCQSMAKAWDITEEQFITYNPKVVCSALVGGMDYCVEQNVKGKDGTDVSDESKTRTTSGSISKSSTSTSTGKPSSTSSESGSSLPTPRQAGMVKRLYVNGRLSERRA